MPFTTLCAKTIAEIRQAIGPTQGRVRRYIAAAKNIILPDPLPTDLDGKIAAYKKHIDELDSLIAHITDASTQIVTTHNTWLQMICTLKISMTPVSNW